MTAEGYEALMTSKKAVIGVFLNFREYDKHKILPFIRENTIRINRPRARKN